MAARRRSHRIERTGRSERTERRRRLGQNFLRPDVASRFVREACVEPGQLVLEIGAGAGAVTFALAEAGADVVAVELDPVWARRLRSRFGSGRAGRVRIVETDFLSLPLPRRSFRVVGSLPFGHTTAILGRLLDDPAVPLARADLIVQWEVACKRAAEPPGTLRSAAWAPWWRFELGRRIPSRDFRPPPSVDAGVLVVTRRSPALLPTRMARAWARFVREGWPFEERRG